MLPARALFYALIISLLIAMITASLVGLTYFYQSHLDENLYEERQLRQLRSGMALLLEDEAREIPEQDKNLYEDESEEKVRWAKYKWGLFSVAWVETVPNPLAPQQSVMRKVALIGESTNPQLLPALYLADRRSPLALSGLTTIRGDALLPQAGVKRGYVDGQNYLGDQLIYGTIGTSKNAIPEPPKGDIRQVINQMQAQRGQSGIRSPLRQSFRDSTVYISGPSLNLSKLDIEGRVVIRATDTIFVGADCRLEDVILLAPTILIEGGFKGTLQALATKKMEIGPGAFLGYPSVLGLVNNQAALPNNNNFLDLQEQSEVRGLVFVYSEAYSRVPERLMIREGAVVKSIFVPREKKPSSHERRRTLFKLKEKFLYSSDCRSLNFLAETLPLTRGKPKTQILWRRDDAPSFSQEFRLCRTSRTVNTFLLSARSPNRRSLSHIGPFRQ